jgi:hypothetical protein
MFDKGIEINLSMSLLFSNVYHKILCGPMVEEIVCGCQDLGSNPASDKFFKIRI